VLVTGGAGYLGYWLVRELAARGHEVRVFDRCCFGRAAVDAWEGLSGVELVTGDIRRFQESPGLLKGIDAVAHLAALANDPSCSLNPDIAHDVNVESSIELARLAAQAGVSRFVFASSCAVYGQGVFQWIDEGTPPNPVSDFGETKLAAEQALLAMNDEQFEVAVVRNSSLYGYSPRMRFDLAVNLMAATALKQGRIFIKGGGKQWRPFLHVTDAARAYADLLEAPPRQVAGEVYNLGAESQNFQIEDLAARVGAILGVPVEKARDDDDLRTYRVSFGKIARALSFEARVSIEDGVREVREAIESRGLDPMAELYSNAGTYKRLLDTPVAEGGEPVAARFVPLARPVLGPEEERAVAEALRSGWLASGPKIAAFEKGFRSLVGAPGAVATSSCTAALHLCLVVAGVKPGDEIITSPITWASSTNTMVNMGAVPVFADIEPDTLNMDPESLRTKITDRTKAIMPVHIAGHPANMDAIRATAAEKGIPVIEDAAHAMGASYKGVKIGTLSPYSCFSFYATKNITTMEGGMITVQDEAQVERLRFLATNGMSTTAWERYGRSSAAAPAQVVEPGFKYLMSNVHAAMGVEQLKKFSKFQQARKRLAHLYTMALGELDEIHCPGVRDDIEHAWHLYIIRFKLDRLTRTRDELAHDLRRENIGTGIHFYGLHLHPYYQERYGFRAEDLPAATHASDCILSLPLCPDMTDKHVNDVVRALKKVLAHARKA
jgi:dTDP-4-amino-4,6-dideoxygalactose transaminase/nucleoside-diphosphate-sugar epimerase